VIVSLHRTDMRGCSANSVAFPLLEGFKGRNGLRDVKRKSLRARILEAKLKEIVFHAERDSTFRKLNLTVIVKESNYRDALSATKGRMDEGITKVGNYYLYEVDRDHTPRGRQGS